MKIYEEEPLITEKLWRKEGNFIKQCRSVQTEAKVIYEQEKKNQPGYTTTCDKL